MGTVVGVRFLEIENKTRMGVANHVLATAAERFDDPKLVEQRVESVPLVEVFYLGSCSEVSPAKIKNFVLPSKVADPVDTLFDRHGAERW